MATESLFAALKLLTPGKYLQAQDSVMIPLSVPYCAGFRNGMCHLSNHITLTQEKKLNILEIPLTIMDTTLFSLMHLDFIGVETYRKAH